MTASEVLAGPAGAWIAIFAMAAATYTCRISGALIMSRFRVTPRVERGLRALPGSIVVSTILPIAADAGWPAALGLAAGLGAMLATRLELAALVAGLATVAGARAIGL
jgi:uncharacterized membrane protein